MAGWAALALAWLASSASTGDAQDSAAVPRHLLALDVSRVQPYQRLYDMIVHERDSSHVVGQREVVFGQSTYGGNPVWMLVETRTGIVPAVETLYVAPNLRPVHWSSALGAARLGAEFVGDSIFGATTTPGGRRSLVLAGRPDLLVSVAMIETLLSLLPLSPEWIDSAAMLAVDAGAGSVIPAELSVIGAEDLFVDSLLARPAWVVALRSDSGNILFWVDQQSGQVHRMQQTLPAHAGSLLEYRIRIPPSTLLAAPPPPPEH